jgi:hypothetical protein
LLGAGRRFLWFCGGSSSSLNSSSSLDIAEAFCRRALNCVTLVIAEAFFVQSITCRFGLEIRRRDKAKRRLR